MFMTGKTGPWRAGVVLPATVMAIGLGVAVAGAWWLHTEAQADQVLSALTGETLPALQEKYPGLTYSFEGSQADRRESMQSLMRGLTMALLVIYAMLAIPFNSFIQPLIIMMCIPFGIVGAVIGHLLMGYSLSVISMMGIVALSGVVVNDSLVLIDPHIVLVRIE